MDIFEALYTTRSMRRVRPDPIPFEVQQRILDAAVRAPNGGNAQGWRFVLVDAPEVKASLGSLYRDAAQASLTAYYPNADAILADPDPTPQTTELGKMIRSGRWLSDNWEQVPLFLLVFNRSGQSDGSIYPAVWSAMLAARAEGIGTSLTTMMGARHGAQVLAALGVPADEGWVNVCCVTFGYPTGRWDVAQRQPIPEVTYRNRWGQPSGFTDDGPLWPDQFPGDATTSP